MKKVLFLTPYPIGEAPSQRFRFEQFTEYLEKEGFELYFKPFYSPKLWRILYKKGSFIQKSISIIGFFLNRFLLFFQLKKYAIIFIHKGVAPLGPPIFEFILIKVFRKKTIYDFDDAIWLPNYSKANAKFQKIKMYGKVHKIIKWADQITVGNQYLKGYAQKINNNVTIIPTTIDTENYHNILTNHKAEKLVIGWTGTHSTMHYLQFIFPIIKTLEKKYDFEFRIISDQKPEINLKSLNYIPWKKTTEIEDLSKIHIGIMPLEADQWSLGKCGFKGLQYMALEIATILSPIGVNKDIISNGENGFLAQTKEEWYQKIIQLLEDSKLRERLGKNGRKTVIERYSIAANKEKYLTVLKAVQEK